MQTSAPRLNLRTLKLFAAAQSASHRAPFPGARQARLPYETLRTAPTEPKNWKAWKRPVNGSSLDIGTFKMRMGPCQMEKSNRVISSRRCGKQWELISYYYISLHSLHTIRYHYTGMHYMCTQYTLASCPGGRLLGISTCSMSRRGAQGIQGRADSVV